MAFLPKSSEARAPMTPIAPYPKSPNTTTNAISDSGPGATTTNSAVIPRAPNMISKTLRRPNQSDSVPVAMVPRMPIPPNSARPSAARLSS